MSALTEIMNYGRTRETSYLNKQNNMQEKEIEHRMEQERRSQEWIFKLQKHIKMLEAELDEETVKRIREQLKSL